MYSFLSNPATVFDPLEDYVYLLGCKVASVNDSSLWEEYKALVGAESFDMWEPTHPNIQRVLRFNFGDIQVLFFHAPPPYTELIQKTYGPLVDLPEGYGKVNPTFSNDTFSDGVTNPYLPLLNLLTYDQKPIYVGFGLGAAYAQLAARFWSAWPVSTPQAHIGYGSPRIGDLEYASGISFKCRRLALEGDIVPSLPILGGWVFDISNIFDRPRVKLVHAGSYTGIKASGELSRDYQLEDGQRRNLTASQLDEYAGMPAYAHHNPTEYLSAVYNAAGSAEKKLILPFATLNATL